MTNSNYPVSMSFPLRWGEMDALGHVNNAVYFSFFEDVRIKYLERLGFNTFTPEFSLGAVLAQIDCQFLRQLEYPDTITLGCRVERIGNTSLTMIYEVYSENLNAIAAKGSSVVVMVNYQTGQKFRVPEEMRQKIAELEGSK